MTHPDPMTHPDATADPAPTPLGPGLPPVPGPSPATVARLRTRLATAAAAEVLVDVAIDEIDTPVGRLLLAATDRGLARVAFEREGLDAVRADLARSFGPRVLRHPARLAPAAREITEYLAGRRHTFDLPLDLSSAHGFRRTVLDHLRGIGYGRTESYAAVAAAVGSPRAVRAVGTACATNPLPLVVPCHRVVRSDGTIGRYLGGTRTKATLLALEAA